MVITFVETAAGYKRAHLGGRKQTSSSFLRITTAKRPEKHRKSSMRIREITRRSILVVVS
jgi:hypothetical protein